MPFFQYFRVLSWSDPGMVPQTKAQEDVVDADYEDVKDKK
jgi:hypothetical protein